MAKYVYTFGGSTAEGNAKDKNLLGGKGANLAEMCLLGIPVPAGFTVSTECCTAYYENGCTLPAELTEQVVAALRKTEAVMGMQYGNPENPLLVSCRSGARAALACATLKMMGFENVANLEGGFGAWQAAGLPSAEHHDGI